MKFAESLSNGVVPEWEPQYLDYKKGKKIIKKVKDVEDDTPQNNKSKNTNDRTPLLQPLDPSKKRGYGHNESSSFFREQTLPPEDPNKNSTVSFKTTIFTGKSSINQQKKDDTKREFQEWLSGQYHKVESFYREREQEVYERFLILEDQLYQLKEHRMIMNRQKQTQLKNLQTTHVGEIAVYKRVNELAYHTKSAFSYLNRFDLPSLPSKVFMERIKKSTNSSDISMTDTTPHEVDANYFENRIRNGLAGDRSEVSSLDSDSLNEFSLSADGSRSSGVQVQQTPEMARKRKRRDYESTKRQFSVPFQVARKQLKEAMLEHYRSLVLLKSYKEMNRTAFRKITKKFDKSTGSSISVEYVKKIDTESYFMTSDLLEKLVNQSEELYISFFHLESSDRKHSLEKFKSIAYALNNNQVRMSSYYPESFFTGVFLGVGLPLFVLALYTGLRKVLDDTLPEGRFMLQIWGGFFLLTMMFLLFGLNMLIFDRFKINYKFIFEFHIATALDYKQYLVIPAAFFGFMSLLMWFSMHDYWRAEFPGRDWPWIYFGTGLVVFFWPFNQFYLSARRWLQVALFRILFSGFYPVEFRDFFLGDLLCSLTYTMGNISFFFCLYSHHWNGMLNDSGAIHDVCGSSKSRSMGFFAALPSIFRFLQCVRRYTDTGDWFPHLANMLKYAVGAVYYALLSVYRLNKSNTNRIVFIVMASINSIYTATWDIVMDWSLLQFESKNWLLRDNLFYEKPVYYYFAMVADVLLRFQWIFYAFFSNQIQQSAATSFLIAVAELVRRIIWVFFRMENEHVTNVILFRASRDSPLPYAISAKVERAIKKLVSLRYSEGNTYDIEDVIGVSSSVRTSANVSFDSEANIETSDVHVELPQLTRRKSTFAVFSDALNKAHIKDFQRRKHVTIDVDTDDDDDDDASIISDSSHRE